MDALAKLKPLLAEIREIADNVALHDGVRTVEELRATLHREMPRFTVVVDARVPPGFHDWRDAFVCQCEIVIRLIDRFDEFPERADFKRQLMDAARELGSQALVGESALSILQSRY